MVHKDFELKSLSMFFAKSNNLVLSSRVSSLQMVELDEREVEREKKYLINI